MKNVLLFEKEVNNDHVKILVQSLLNFFYIYIYIYITSNLLD